jgi:hypothetical protein
MSFKAIIPPGPTIPSDVVNSKSKVNDLLYPYSKLVLPSYSTQTTSLLVQIPDAPAGMVIFNSFTEKLNFFTGSAWKAISSA